LSRALGFGEAFFDNGISGCGGNEVAPKSNQETCREVWEQARVCQSLLNAKTAANAFAVEGATSTVKVTHEKEFESQAL